MPGKNSGWDPSKDHICLQYIKVWHGVVFAVIFLEVSGMTRYFYMWEKKRWCAESLFWTFYLSISDFFVF